MKTIAIFVAILLFAAVVHAGTILGCADGGTKFAKIQVQAQTQYHAFDNRDGDGVYKKSTVVSNFPVANAAGAVTSFVITAPSDQQLPFGNVTVNSIANNIVVLQFDPVIGFLTPQLCQAGKANDCVTWFIQTVLTDNGGASTSACKVGINVVDTCFKTDPQCNANFDNNIPVSLTTAVLFAIVLIFVIAIPLYIVRVRLRSEPKEPVHIGN